MSETTKSWYEEVDDACQFIVEILDDDRLHLRVADDDVQRNFHFLCTPEEYISGTAKADDRQSIRQLIEHNMSANVAVEIERELKNRIA